MVVDFPNKTNPVKVAFLGMGYRLPRLRCPESPCDELDAALCVLAVSGRCAIGMASWVQPMFVG